MSVGHIPAKLLVHSIQIIDQATQTWYDVSKVLMQLKRGVIFTGVGEEVVAQSLLYVDLEKSVYESDTVFRLGNVVVFNNERYTIKNIKYVTGLAEHHLEITVV